jgi:tRNA-2-methylthio-N6-dimethylallyladenosine synthase
LREVRALVDQGVIEITLLGQNVNAYGVDFGDRLAFLNYFVSAARLMALERVRFMSPHPRDFTDDVIDAMAQTPNVMPHLHMPLQSGSDKVLKAYAPLIPQRSILRNLRKGSKRHSKCCDYN